MSRQPRSCKKGECVMKVSQYLYTSYKNSPNGGYAVYSMSSDISQEDAKVIFLLMQYPAVPMLSDMRRSLNNMTWNPVDMKDIEGVCPRNFAYFKLPSGKYCLAESGYIGPEFKGFTPSGRTGNYLIHALIMDKVEKLPILYMGSNIFRHDLTLEEWTAKNPAPLPSIDVEPSASFSQSEITAFLNSDNRKEHIKKIVTILKDKNNKQPIFINDKLENARLWISAISLLLPPEEAKEIFFNTYSYDDNNVKLGLPEGSKYRIQFITGSSSRMKLQQKLLTSVVVDIPNNQFTQNLTVDELVDQEEKYLEKDIYSAMTFIATIERIKNTYGVDNHMAVRINELEKNGLDNYDVNEALELLNVYSRGTNLSRFIPDAFNNVISGKYPKGEATLAMERFLYPLLSEADKEKYVHFIFDPYLQSSNQNENAFINETKNKYSNIYKEFAHLYPLSGEGKEILNKNSNNHALLALYLDSLFSDSSYNIDKDKEVLYDLMMKICEESYNNNDKQFMAYIANVISPYLVTFKSDLYKKIVDKIDIKSYQEYFLYLKDINDINYVANRLYKLLIYLSDKKEAYTAYSNFVKSDINRYQKIDDALIKRDDIKNIIKTIEKDDFASAPRHTNESLKSYYEKYYLKDDDEEGLFIKAFKDYLLLAIQPNDISYWLDIFTAQGVKDEDKAIYSALLSSLEKIAGGDLGRYRNEFNALKHLGAVSSNVEVKLFAEDLLSLKEVMMRQRLMDKNLYASIFNGVDDNNRKFLFARTYFRSLVTTLLKYKTVSFSNDATLFNNICAPYADQENMVNDLYNLCNLEKIDADKYFVILYLASKSGDIFSPIADKIYKKLSSNMTPKDKKGLAKFLTKEVRQDKEGQYYHELKKLADELNGIVPLSTPTNNKPPLMNNNPNFEEIKIDPQQKGSSTSSNADVNNTQKQTNEVEEKKGGFWNNLFHKKK